MAKQDIEREASKLGLTLTSEFVPFSRSRNAKEKLPSLNWKVTLRRKGRDIITTDYMAGSAHCPSYKQRQTIDVHNAVAAECEAGRDAKTRKQLNPAFADVLYSLVLDADVLNAPSFEDWAGNFGYDGDSRKAEQMYRACLEIALKLRNSIGEDGLAKLQIACEGY